jgi:hypothetical protein
MLFNIQTFCWFDVVTEVPNRVCNKQCVLTSKRFNVVLIWILVLRFHCGFQLDCHLASRQNDSPLNGRWQSVRDPFWYAEGLHGGSPQDKGWNVQIEDGFLMFQEIVANDSLTRHPRCNQKSNGKSNCILAIGFQMEMWLNVTMSSEFSKTFLESRAIVDSSLREVKLDIFKAHQRDWGTTVYTDFMQFSFKFVDDAICIGGSLALMKLV